ncbi:MAG: hypothetical protein HC889_11575, partial [Synechococcaceae cyanobacterium SM1_2_3]|nr:hypothetical protein [Synechococcaceae cyanobacterium SM1_2_3]
TKHRAELAFIHTACGYRFDDPLNPLEKTAKVIQEILARDWTEYRAELASTLGVGSTTLFYLLRTEEALNYIEEADKIFQTLIEDGQTQHLRQLAAARMTQGFMFACLLRYQEALASVQEAAKIFHNLIKKRPDAIPSGTSQTPDEQKLIPYASESPC